MYFETNKNVLVTSLRNHQTILFFFKSMTIPKKPVLYSWSFLFFEEINF